MAYLSEVLAFIGGIAAAVFGKAFIDFVGRDSNKVNQRGAQSGGDIVGRDKTSK